MQVQENQRHQLSIAFDNVTVHRGKSVVLDKVSGMIHGGRLTAVVSCCGNRGDYYLLNVLAGNEESTGNVIANGTPVMSTKYRNSAALIDEDLATMDELTVKQNLMYSGEMRLSGAVDVRELVEKTMEALSLTAFAHQPVKQCPVAIQRTVALAKELILDPSAVFLYGSLDGLATHDARQLLTMLKADACETGRIIVISMVQPRWVFLELVDDVLLIEGQKVVFSGTTRDLMDCFVQKRKSQIEGENDDVMSECHDYISDNRLESAMNKLYKQAASPMMQLDDIFPENSPMKQKSSMQLKDFMMQCARGEQSLNLPSSRQEGPYSIVKFFHLLKYSLLQVRNNLIVHVIFTLFLLAVAVVCAVIYTGQNGQSGMQNRIGILFFLISATFIQNVLFVNQRKKLFWSYQRHRAQGYFGPLTFLAYWTVTTACTRFFGALVFVVLVYGLANVNHQWDMTSLKDLVVIVALTSFSSALVIWLICCIMSSVRTIHFTCFAVFTFCTILAGIMLNVTTLPAPIQVISYGSIIRLGYESAILSQFEGQAFGCVAPVVNVTTASCYTGDMYVQFLGFKQERKWANIEIMGIISAISLFLCYVALWRAPLRTVQ